MKRIFPILLLLGLLGTTFKNVAQTKPDFVWGNCAYFNLNVGDSILYDSTSIRLLSIENQYNQLKVGTDTLEVKVSGRSLPHSVAGLQLFVADNRSVKALSDNTAIHGLQKKDVLLCISDRNREMLDKKEFVFPVSFNQGFVWDGEEDTYMFSYLCDDQQKKYETYPGIGIDLKDARGLEKHWLVAIENSTVVWVDKAKDGETACVLLASDSSPGIYYVYDCLYEKTLEVKKEQKLVRGELIGTAWGNANWGHAHLAVVRNDTIPSFEDRFMNCVNFFPQLYELYYAYTYSTSKSYSKGKISFGRAASHLGNDKNNAAFEEYLGKGWILGRWNRSDKVEAVSVREGGNVRLAKKIFSGTPAESINPNDYFEYEINVRNGVYRIRAKVGDLKAESWQKIEYEGVPNKTFSLPAGEQKWTDERTVRVEDRKLTVRVYVDTENKKAAGLSEIVFQLVY
ncbi:MAG: hypothetical protein ACK5HT_07115 [Draconibacterium sp.]